MATPTAEQLRLATFYNGNAYDPAANAGGMDNNGHYFNFIPALRDVAAVGSQIESTVQRAEAAATQSEAWVLESSTVTRLSASSLSILGYAASTYTVGRALQIIQTANATGWVESVSYNSGTGLTIITVTGCSVDTGFTQLWFGQDVANAPKQSASTQFTPLAAQIFG